MNTVFFQLGIMIVVATFFAYFAKFLKQPLIPAYVFAGLLLGPVFGVITDPEAIQAPAEIGIAFLLFVVGLEMDISKLMDVGIVTAITGFLKSAIISTLGFFAAQFFGFSSIEAVYIGLILAFSSTMVVVKLLSDKREIDTLHGRIIIGILLVEDVLAIFVLSMLDTLDSITSLAVGIALFKAIALIVLSIIAVRFIFPKILGYAAEMQELLFLSAIALCLGFALFFNYIGTITLALLSVLQISVSSEIALLIAPGFSLAIGAFVAGLGMASLPYNLDVIGKIKPLKDFFAIIFFVSLGLELTLTTTLNLLPVTLALLLIVVIIKPIAILFFLSILGFRKRSSFLTAISLVQISEFSLIIASQIKHTAPNIFIVTVIVSIITTIITSYTIKYDVSIYYKFQKILTIFDHIGRKRFDYEHLPKEHPEVILCGHNRMGFSIMQKLQDLKRSVLIIDFNPNIIKELIAQGIHSIYGDIGDPEIWSHIDLRHAKYVISTVPDKFDSIRIIKRVKHEHRTAKVFVTANQVNDALDLYEAGADYVILPHFLGGDHVAFLLEEFNKDIAKMIAHRVHHIKHLHQRKLMGHEHPGHQ